LADLMTDRELWAFCVGWAGLGPYLGKSDQRDVMLKLLEDLCQHYAGVRADKAYAVEVTRSPVVRRVRLLEIPLMIRRGVLSPKVTSMVPLEDSNWVTWKDQAYWMDVIRTMLRRFSSIAVPREEVERRIIKGQGILDRYHHADTVGGYPLPAMDLPKPPSDPTG